MHKALKAYSRWFRLLAQRHGSAILSGTAVARVLRLTTDMDFQIVEHSPVLREALESETEQVSNVLELFADEGREQARLADTFQQQLYSSGKIDQRIVVRGGGGASLEMCCQAEYVQHMEPQLIWRLEALNYRHSPDDLNTVAAKVYDKSGAGMLIVDERLTIVSANAAFCQASGFSLQTLSGNTASIVCDSVANPEFYRKVLNGMSAPSGFRCETSLTRKDGTQFPAYLLANELQQLDDGSRYYLWLVLDISKQKQLESELRSNAEVDPLTQLGNRKLLFQKLEAATASAKRFGYDVALLFLDLDGFKQINDQFGHGEGDKVLLEVAQRLRGCVRQVDTVARLGGDEFVVILNGTSKDLITVTAQRIVDFLTLTIKGKSADLLVTTSIGIAMYPQDSHNPLVLLKYADEAMYKAKAKGKRQFCWHIDRK